MAKRNPIFSPSDVESANATIRRFIASKRLNRHDAEEVKQEAWVNLIRRLDFASLAPAHKQALSVLAAKSASSKVRLRRARRPDAVSLNELGEASVVDRAPKRSMRNEKFTAALDDANARLPSRYQTVMNLLYIEGLSLADAAAFVGLTKAATAGVAKRAKVALRRRLSAMGWDPALRPAKAHPGCGSTPRRNDGKANR